MTATSTAAKTTKKAPAKSAPAAVKQDAFAIPSMPAMDVPPVFRDFAENSVTQSKEAYAKFKETAEEATALLEDTIEKTRDGVVALNSKALEVAQENTDATLSHFKDVVGVKTLSEAIELQTAFLKTQMNAIQDQTKAFQDLTVKLNQQTSAPYKKVFAKSLETIKGA